MKRVRKRSGARTALRVILCALLVYLAAGLLPCMILPSYPESRTEDWPVTGAGSDAAMLVETGSESRDIRLALISSAEEHIRLGTYIFGVDESGKETMAALYQAAERGVQVDILTDGLLGVFNFHDDPLVHALGSHRNVHIYLYNPVDLLKPWNLNGRYHEKYLVADGAYALLGGRNVSDEFLVQDTPGYSYDLEVLLKRTGGGISAVDLLTERFDGVICSAFCSEAYGNGGGEQTEQAGEFLRTFSVRGGTELSGLPLVPVEKAVLLGSDFDPGDKTPDVMAGLKTLTEEVEHSLIWCSPYFCPDEPMKQVLQECAELEACMMITNSAATGNNIIASADGVFHRGTLNQLPCQVWEVQSEYSMHTKALLIDESISVIGSFNADMRSAYLDTELMIALDSPELAEHTKTYLTGLRDLSTPVSEQAKATGLGSERADVPFPKNLQILLLSPFVALIRYLI